MQINHIANQGDVLETLSYPYQPKAGVNLAASLLFGVLSIWLGATASGNDHGLSYRGLEIGESGATVFYWCLTLMCVGGTVLTALGFMVGLMSPLTLTLTPTEISAPRTGFSRKVINVRLADVVRMDVQAVQKYRFLNVYHRRGKLVIVESCLPSSAAFEQLCTAIGSRFRAVKA